MTFNRWHLIALVIGILGGAGAVTFGPLSQRHADQVVRQRADSLEHVIALFEPRHDSLVRVDTVRAIQVVTLRSHADTIIQQIVTAHPTDTVLVVQVDSAAVAFRQALDTLGQRVTFWRASFDTVRTQRDNALAQLRGALNRRDPILSFGFGPVVAVGYNLSGGVYAGPGFGFTMKIRLPF